MTETKTLTLSKPIKDTDGKEIRDLTLREPTVGDLIAAESFTGRIAYTTAMIAAITGIVIPVLKTMTATDFDRVDRAIGELMGNSRGADGETPPS
jgi:hypothetical protein